MQPVFRAYHIGFIFYQIQLPIIGELGQVTLMAIVRGHLLGILLQNLVLLYLLLQVYLHHLMVQQMSVSRHHYLGVRQQEPLLTEYKLLQTQVLQIYMQTKQALIVHIRWRNYQILLHITGELRRGIQKGGVTGRLLGILQQNLLIFHLHQL